MTQPQTASYYATVNTNEQVHEVQPPPEDHDLAIAIVAILLSGVAIYLQIKAIALLLAPLGISKQAAILGYSVAKGDHSPNRPGVPSTRTLPNNAPSQHGLARSEPVMQRARRTEASYRALYLVSAAKRIQEELNAGKPVKVALADESLHYRQHEKARRGRLNATAKVAKAAKLYGDVLGWYLNPLLNNETECITANGHNFSADEGTVLGFPGAVHPNCGCTPGPPWPGGLDNHVNIAVANVIRFTQGRKFKIKQKAS